MSFKIDDKSYDFIDKSLPKPSYTLRRFKSESQNHRYYYEILEDGTVILYSSLTTMIGSAYPEPFDALTEWKLKMRMQGKDPDAFANERANYGTIMHVLFGCYLMGEKIPVNPTKLKEFLETQDTGLSQERVNKVLDTEGTELCRDMLAFAQFIDDYNVKPLAIEIMLRHPEYMVATPIDLICEMDYPVKGYHGEIYKTKTKYNNVGDPKVTTQVQRINAEIDFKSGRKGFYDKHALQLGIGKRIIEANYPKLKIDYMFNFSPKDWKDSPSYNLKDQTNHPVLEEMDDVLSIGKKRFLKQKRRFKEYGGTLDVNAGFDYSLFTSEREISELLSEYHKNLKDGNTQKKAKTAKSSSK